MIRVGAFVTHPIQYFSPIFRDLATRPNIRFKVYYFSKHSIEGGVDKGFGREVAWDVPLLEGYDFEFVSERARLDMPQTVDLPQPLSLMMRDSIQAVYIHGYFRAFEKQLLGLCPRVGIPVIMRGEFDQRAYVDDDGNRPSWIRQALKRMMVRRRIRHVSAFGVIGSNAREFLCRCGVDPQRQFFSPYSIDDALLTACGVGIDRSEVRKQLGIPASAFVVLFSGKLIPRKGVEVLIKAIAACHDRRVHLLVLGDGPLREQHYAMANNLIAGRWTGVGFVNQSKLPMYFLAADAFALPSVFETWGLVVNEAMLFGLPVVCSDGVGCVPDLVSSGETGYIFPSGNASALANCLEKLSAMSGLELARMKERVACRISRYSTSAAADGIHAAINYAVGESKS